MVELDALSSLQAEARRIAANVDISVIFEDFIVGSLRLGVAGDHIGSARDVPWNVFT
jgi:hypothetical protein